MLDAIQSDFTAAVLDPDRAIPSAITSHTSRAPQKRFAVYRNNVAVGLVDALRARFPATQRIVGAEFFAAMARVYVTAHPPRSPVLLQYGDGFPSFVETFEPAGELPYLPEVARLEAARTRAYHAADAEPIHARGLEAISPEDLLNARAALHPSAQVVRSRHPIVTIWAMNSGELEPAPIDNDQAEDALVVRPHLTVLVHRLPSGGAVLINAMAGGATFGEAIEQATATEHHAFDLPANLAALIGSGALATILPSDPDKG
jgi:hypothetical protein